MVILTAILGVIVAIVGGAWSAFAEWGEKPVTNGTVYCAVLVLLCGVIPILKRLEQIREAVWKLTWLHERNEDRYD